MDKITFNAASGPDNTVIYAVLYGPQPRWWWCRFLPKSWRWAWPDRFIAYYDMGKYK